VPNCMPERPNPRAKCSRPWPSLRSSPAQSRARRSGASIMSFGIGQLVHVVGEIGSTTSSSHLSTLALQPLRNGLRQVLRSRGSRQVDATSSFLQNCLIPCPYNKIRYLTDRPEAQEGCVRESLAVDLPCSPHTAHYTPDSIGRPILQIL